MTRSKMREHLFCMLFQRDFHQEEELSKQLTFYLESIETMQEEEERLSDTFQKVIDHLDEIDKLIDENAQGWKISRLGKVDLSIIRLAIYEILYDEEIPVGVAINEAVELAKKFGEEHSSSFINGILGKIAEAQEEV